MELKKVERRTDSTGPSMHGSKCAHRWLLKLVFTACFGQNRLPYYSKSTVHGIHTLHGLWWTYPTLVQMYEPRLWCHTNSFSFWEFTCFIPLSISVITQVTRLQHKVEYGHLWRSLYDLGVCAQLRFGWPWICIQSLWVTCLVILLTRLIFVAQGPQDLSGTHLSIQVSAWT